MSKSNPPLRKCSDQDWDKQKPRGKKKGPPKLPKVHGTKSTKAGNSHQVFDEVTPVKERHPSLSTVPILAAARSITFGRWRIKHNSCSQQTRERDSTWKRIWHDKLRRRSTEVGWAVGGTAESLFE
uniref:Uncharacterized protein n=1 Tax=Micrurus carvalhoi TaxID=3147026 RepID=A0A2H6N429_9SAUR